jgi:hypothetical protein
MRVHDLGSLKMEVPMSDREYRVVPLDHGEVRTVKDEEGRVGIKGSAAVFRSVTDLGPFTEEIAPGAFDNALKDGDVRGLFNHDSNFVLGRTKSGTMSLKATNDSLDYDIPELPKSRTDVAESIERGDVDGNSFSFSVRKDEWTRNDNGKDHRVIVEIDTLYDVGPVTFPAYADTSVAMRSRDRAIRAGDLPEPDAQRKEAEAEKAHAIELARAKLDALNVTL